MLSFLPYIAFQVGVSFLCLHQKGAELARRGPTLLGPWLNQRRRTSAAEDQDASSPISADLKPPTSVAQIWRLGALHERIFEGQHGDHEAALREAGDVLGVGRSLTEAEFSSLARVAERTPNRSRFPCPPADFLMVAAIIGIVSTAGPAVYYLLSPITPFVDAVLEIIAENIRSTPMFVLGLVTLSISLTVVCDGFRAADKEIGGRLALTGVAGGVATLCLRDWDDEPWHMVVLFFFTATVLAPVAFKFDSELCGFLAVLAAYCFGWASIAAPFDIYGATRVIPPLCGSATAGALFCCAAIFGVKTKTLQQFASGTMATGVSALHLVLFFFSFSAPDEWWANILVQLPVYAALLASWSLGFTTGCNGLINNAYLFGVLYLFASAISLSGKLPGGDGTAVGLAAVSFGSWRAALYLHRHHGFLSSLWTLDAGFVRRCVQN